MSDITPRPNRNPSRRSREDRAYKLVIAGGTAAIVFVVTFVLALVGVLSSYGIPILALLVAALCGWMFRRTVS